jgi:predicted transcriptional regulator of viral defense system
MEPRTHRRIEDYLDDHGGIIRTQEFQRAGLHNVYLATLVDEGRIVRLKPGLYLATESQTASGFFEVQLALPNAVICLASALAHHELSTYEPPEVQVAIPRGDRTRPPDFPPSRRFSFADDRYNLGIKIESIDGREIRIYDREKSVCDAIRFRRTLGQDVVNEAVRSYLGQSRRDIDKVIKYSRALRQEGPVRDHLRISA